MVFRHHAQKGKMFSTEGKVPGIRGKAVHFPGRDGRGWPPKEAVESVVRIYKGKSVPEMREIGSLSPKRKTQKGRREHDVLPAFSM